MALGLRRGVVSAILERRDRLVRSRDGRASHFQGRTGPLEVGDEAVNEQARLPELGSRRLRRPLCEPDSGSGPAHRRRCALPVSPCCTRPARWRCDGRRGRRAAGGARGAAAALHAAQPGRSGVRRARRCPRAYVQVQGGALPVSLSEPVSALQEACSAPRSRSRPVWTATSTALRSWSRRSSGLRARTTTAIVSSVGPGSSAPAPRSDTARSRWQTWRTSRRRSTGGPCWRSGAVEADPRERHRGVSHHARAVLDLCLGEVAAAEEQDGDGWEVACGGLPLSHMGRGPADDPTSSAPRTAGSRRAATGAVMEERRLGPVVGLAPGTPSATTRRSHAPSSVRHSAPTSAGFRHVPGCTPRNALAAALEGRRDEATVLTKIRRRRLRRRGGSSPTSSAGSGWPGWSRHNLVAWEQHSPWLEAEAGGGADRAARRHPLLRPRLGELARALAHAGASRCSRSC